MFCLLVVPILFNKVAGNILSGLPTPTPTIEITRSDITKRDDSVPTINLGDIRKYVFDQGAPHPDAPNLGKRDVTIAPDGFHETIPEEGITIGLGEEIAEEIGKIVEEKCKDNKNMHICIEEVRRALETTQLSTHTKRFILLTAGAVAFLIEWVIPAIIVIGSVGGGLLLNDKKESKVHLPHEENGPLAQIETLKDDVSGIAFATGTGDDTDVVATVTITQTPTPIPNPDKRIGLEEITADSGENKKGDVLIHIPEDLDRRLKDYLGVLGLEQVRAMCEEDRKAHAISRRSGIGSRADRPPPVTERCRTGIRDLSRSSVFALDDETNMQMIPANPNNPANLETHPDGAAVPEFNIDDVNAAVMIARQFQKGRANNRPGANPFYRSLIVASLVLRYVQEVSLVVNEVQEVVKIIKWSVENIQRVTQKDAECQNDLVCFSDDCKGYEEKNSFLGLDGDTDLEQTGSCTVKANKGCSCEVLPEPIVRQISDSYFENLQKFMQDIDDSVSHPTCSTDDSINFDTARFDEAIDGACHNHNELRRSKRHGAAFSRRDSFGYYNTDKDNLRWHLTWDDNGGECMLKCEDVFRQMLYYDKCRWWGGAAKKGSVLTECGVASYEVEFVPPPPPPPPPSSEPQLPDSWYQYAIVLDHEIVGPGNWQLTWELFADPWGVNVKVEGPATYRDIGSTTMEIHINVDDADIKEQAKIRFTIADRINPSEKRDAPWYVGPNGDMGQSYLWINECKILEDWHNDNGVWKRRARCGFFKNYGDVFKTLRPIF